MNIERALRKFRAYGKELKQELLERKEYKKPSVKRNATRQAAIRRNRRKNQELHNSQANWKAKDRKLKKLRMSDALDSEKQHLTFQLHIIKIIYFYIQLTRFNEAFHDLQKINLALCRKVWYNIYI